MKKNFDARCLEQFFGKNADCADYSRRYCSYLAKLLTRIDYDAVGLIARDLIEARERGSTIFFAGNGGSAATASHFAQDLAEISRKTGGKGFRSLSLCDSVSSITALGNDYGYETVFAAQLDGLFKTGDILIAISASGNSANILEAVKVAKKLHGKVIGLVGFDGGKLRSICDRVIHIETGKGEYGPVEDAHLVIDHIVTSYLTLRDVSFMICHRGYKARAK